MRRENGLSLIELSTIVAILGIIAIVVAPNLSTVGPKKLDLAAQRVAEAARFARSEAMRSGEHHGLTVSQVTQEVTVGKWDLTTDPVSVEAITHDPMSRHAFRFGVDELSAAPGIRITNTTDAFLYADIGRRRSLIFDPQGVPIWVLGSNGSTYLLEEGIISLGASRGQRSVTIAPLTGRVTVQ